MADLRFVARAPQKKRPRTTLLAAGVVVLLVAAFGVSRLWTRPAATGTAPAGLPAEPAALTRATGADLPAAAPTPALRPAEPKVMTSSEVFHNTRVPAPTPSAAPATTAEPDSVAKQAARCLSLTARTDPMFTVTSGVRLLVKAQNHCGLTFSGADARFEVRALAANGTGVAGRELGFFQTSIPPFATAETTIVVPCDPDVTYRFEVVAK